MERIIKIFSHGGKKYYVRTLEDCKALFKRYESKFLEQAQKVKSSALVHHVAEVEMDEAEFLCKPLCRYANAEREWRTDPERPLKYAADLESLNQG